MHCVNITPEAAEDALVRLAHDVGQTVAIGRPLAVTAATDAAGQYVLIITDLEPPTVWTVYADMTARVVELPDGTGEIATYADGEELDRIHGTRQP